MFGSQTLLTGVAIGAPVVFLIVLGILLWRLRRIHRVEEEKDARDREVMRGRLDEVKDVPPLKVPPSVLSRPEERWTRHQRPKDRFRR